MKNFVFMLKAQVVLTFVLALVFSLNINAQNKMKCCDSTKQCPVMKCKICKDSCKMCPKKKCCDACPKDSCKLGKKRAFKGGVAAFPKRHKQQNGFKRPNPEEMAKNYTEYMTATYNLSDKQATEVEKLNKDLFCPKMQGKKFDTMSNEERAAFMKAQREEYECKLKKILTKKQYKAYQEDKKNQNKRKANRWMRHRGNQEGNRFQSSVGASDDFDD